MIRVTEELLLLIWDAQSGSIQHALPKHQRDLVIAGAVLTDLTLENRIDTDPERLFLIDSKPVNDDLLDPTLLEIVTESEPHDTRYWIQRIAPRSGEIRKSALRRLIRRGILVADANGLVFPSRSVARAQLYPTVDGKSTKHVQARVMEAIFSDEIPELRDIIIIGLAVACGVFESIFSRSELADVQERIDSIARLDLIGRVISDSVQAVPPATPRRQRIRNTDDIPQVEGLPIVGSVFQMTGDIVDFLSQCYYKYGPIFRIRVFGNQLIALVGPKANEFVTQISKTHLRSFESWWRFGLAFGGAHRVLLSMDGPEHIRMRKLMVNGYSPKMLGRNLDAAHALTLGMIDEWPRDRPIVMQRTMQEIVAEQIGLCLTGTPAKEYTDDLIHYLSTLISIYVSRRLPKLMEFNPRFRRSKGRIEELYNKIMEAHKPDRRMNREPDFVDDLLEMHRKDPQFLPETDLRANVIAPYMVGIDTSASTCAYMLHAILREPQLLTRARDEVDAMFKRGKINARGIRRLDVTHRIALETLRMYPVIPVLPRTVSNSFDFAGYNVPAGANILLGTTVSHRLEECFPDPARFDIERYTREARQHLQPGAFAPFGVGHHRCLGAGFAELQIMLTLATIIRETELVLEHPDRPMRTQVSPAPHPHKSVRFRLVRRRRL